LRGGILKPSHAKVARRSIVPGSVRAPNWMMCHFGTAALRLAW
jgi:hypothetical protein